MEKESVWCGGSRKERGEWQWQLLLFKVLLFLNNFMGMTVCCGNRPKRPKCDG